MEHSTKILLTKNLMIVTFMVWAVYSAINSFGAHLYWLGIGEDFKYVNVFIWYYTAAFIWWLLTPLFLWVVNTFTWTSGNWPKILVANILLGIIISPIHRFLSLGLTFWTQNFFNLTERIPISFFEYIEDKFLQLTIEGFLTYFAIIFIFYSYGIFIINRRIKYQNAELENSLMNTQLQVLRSQLNPHFLFNSLHTVNGLIMKKEEKSAIATVTGLSEILRHSMQSSQNQFVQLNEELDILNKYLEIHKIRIGNRLSMTINCEDTLMREKIPCFLLQPLIENSLIHGIMKTTGKGIISLTIKRQENYFHIKIADNGPGISDGIEFGIGINNTIERLKLLYREDFKFTMHNVGNGTEVFIMFPIKWR